MRKLVLASCALAALATSFVTPAQAGPPTAGPAGAKCGYNAVSDPAPDADADAMTGEVHGGPATWDRPFTLRCTLQVDSNVHNGTTNDTLSEGWAATEPAPGQWVAQGQAPINYLSPENSQDYLCTSATYSGGTLYWHPTDPGPDGIANTLDDVPGHWTTDPNTPCSAATQFSTGPIIDLLNELVFEPLDGIAICPALKALAPVVNAIPGGLALIDAEGDLFLDLGANGISEADAENDMFWDCPVYLADGDALDGIID